MSAHLERLKRKAKANRRCLREIFAEGEELLSAIEWVRLSETLEQIRPVEIRKGVLCEPAFKRRKKEIRRQAFALLDAGYPESGIPTRLGLSRTTWWRYRKHHAELCPENTPTGRLNKPSDVSKKHPPVGKVTFGYLDATSGGNVEAEQEFHRRLDAPAAAPLQRLKGDAAERADDMAEELSAIFGRKLKPGSALTDWIIDGIGVGAFCFELRARDWSYGWISEAIAIASRGRWAPSPELLEAHVDRHLERLAGRGGLCPENGSTGRMDERSDVSKQHPPVGQVICADLHLLPEPLAVRVEELMAA